MHQALWFHAQHRHQGHAIEEVLRIGGHDAAGCAGGLFLKGVILVSLWVGVLDLGWHDVSS